MSISNPWKNEIYMCDYRYALEMRFFWVIQMGLNHFGLSWSHKY